MCGTPLPALIRPRLNAVLAPVCLQTNGSRLRDLAFSDQAKWLAVAEGEAFRVWNPKHQHSQLGSTLAVGNFLGPAFLPSRTAPRRHHRPHYCRADTFQSARLVKKVEFRRFISFGSALSEITSATGTNERLVCRRLN
jgi:hypothetical protein